jgi:hypothetical protein
MAKDDDKHTPEETQQRLKRILAGAFGGPPTPLKDIPTEEGKSRRLGGKAGQLRRRRAARRKKAA